MKLVTVLQLERGPEEDIVLRDRGCAQSRKRNGDGDGDGELSDEDWETDNDWDNPDSSSGTTVGKSTQGKGARPTRSNTPKRSRRRSGGG